MPKSRIRVNEIEKRMSHPQERRILGYFTKQVPLARIEKEIQELFVSAETDYKKRQEEYSKKSHKTYGQIYADALQRARDILKPLIPSKTQIFLIFQKKIHSI